MISVKEMNRYLVLLIWLLIFFFNSSALADLDTSGNKNTGISVGICIDEMKGDTRYHIGGTVFIPEWDTDLTWESELEFPLDTYLVGIKASAKGKFLENPYSLNFSAHKNVSAPWQTMKDSDWLGLPEDGFREKFSYTESDAELNASILDVNGHLGFPIHPKAVLEGIVGYKLQKFSYEISGLRGWEITDEGIVYFSEYKGVNVLDYDVTYRLPYLGVAIKMFPSLYSIFNAEIVFSGVSSNDRDDHILRNKLSRSNCQGTAFMGGINGCVMLNQKESQINWFLEFGANFMKISTDGHQEQSWYGDDPISEEDDTGTKISGINNKITSKQRTIFILFKGKF